MCGRYLLTHSPDELRRLFGYVDQPNFPSRYNIAPTQPIAVVVQDRGERRFLLVRWGLIPGWVKDVQGFPLLFNARADSAAEKPAFRAAMRHRRCLIPASGFYEWRRNGKARHPFLIRRRDGAPMALAGLYEPYADAAGNELDTAAVLTTEPNRLMAGIHDRMPVILDPSMFALWLDHSLEPREVASLLRPAPDGALEAVAVSERVNDARSEGESLAEPLCEPIVEWAPASAVSTSTRPGVQGDLF